MKVVIELNTNADKTVLKCMKEYYSYLSGQRYSLDSVCATDSGYLLKLCTGNSWDYSASAKTLTYTGSRAGFISQTHFLLGEGSDFVLFLNRHLCRYTVHSSADCPSANNPFNSGEVVTADMESRVYELDPYEQLEADLMFA